MSILNKKRVLQHAIALESQEFFCSYIYFTTGFLSKKLVLKYNYSKTRYVDIAITV